MDEIIYSGFLTKSPPEYKINRARWQRRWFVLKRNPSAVYLQYYKDPTSSRPKGTIDLNTCEQMDQGLTFDSRRSLANAFIFSIVTPKRKYFLVSNTEEDMIGWVRQICQACGFQLDNQGDGVNTEPEVTRPINVTSQPASHSHIPSKHPASVPAIPTEVAESYIPLDECVTGTGNGATSSQSLPANGGWESSRGAEEVFAMEGVSRGRANTGSSGSDSSIPSLSAPLPPPAQRDSGVMDTFTYEVPPNLQPASTDQQPTYDIPPGIAKSRQPGQLDTSTSEASRLSITDQSRENGDSGDIYDVPPSRDSGGLYDFPPSHPLLRGQNPEMSSSTDKLAQDFQQISVRNSRGAADEGPHDIYSVPPPAVKAAVDPFASQSHPDEESARNQTRPPRPPKHNLLPTTTPQDNQAVVTPPRPPKPQHLRPTPSPPSDEHYDLLPGQMARAQSVYAVPPASANWTDLRSPPNGHQWLDNKVPTPDDVRYINTKKSASRQSMPPQSAGYNLQRHVAPPLSSRSSVLSDTSGSDVRYSPGPCTNTDAQPESYLPMMGSNSTPAVFQYPDMYIAMQGSAGTRPEARLSGGDARLSGGDSEHEPYAIMSGTSGFPTSRQLPPNFHRQTFSGGQRPPPIDRSSKPDRKASEGSVRNTSNIGMAGSFYANSDDIFRPVQDFRPVQSERTMSFCKRPGQYENRKIESDLDPFRGRSNTGDSATSSSDDDMYAAEDNGFSRPVPPVPEEDSHIFTDSPSRHKEGALTDGLSSTPIPAAPPAQQKDDIEYLELSHDHHDEEPSQPPPRPPKPSSPKVEYIDLDLERMQALKQVTEKREEEKDGGVSGRGTLTRRDF